MDILCNYEYKKMNPHRIYLAFIIDNLAANKKWFNPIAGFI